MAWATGFEPATDGFGDRCSSNRASPIYGSPAWIQTTIPGFVDQFPVQLEDGATSIKWSGYEDFNLGHRVPGAGC